METKATYETPKKRVYILRSTITVAIEADNEFEAKAKYEAHDFERISKESVEIIGKLNK